MDTLLKQIKDRLNNLCFNYDEQKDEWTKTESKLFGGGTTYINGKATQDPGQKVKIKSVCKLCGECVITDINTKQIETSLMCNFKSFRNDILHEDVEINIYPSEMNLFNKFLGTIFRMN